MELKTIRNPIAYGKECKETSFDIVSAAPRQLLFDATILDITGQINSMMEKVTQEGYKFKCTVCGKMSKSRHNMSQHIETHIQGVSYPCNLCGTVKTSSNALSLHTSR